MKKLVSLLLIVVCAMSAFTVHAETRFTLRNGIHFGEEQQTVEAKETWTPVKGFHVFDFQGEMLNLPSLVKYNYGGEILGDNEEDDSMLLKSVSYCINTFYDETGGTCYSRKSLFSFVCNSLKIKYGDPLTDSASLGAVCMDPFIRFYLMWLSSLAAEEAADFQSISADGRRAVWIIPFEDRNVVIELQEYDLVQDNQKCYLTLLHYSAYTEFELQKLQKSLADQICDI